MDEADIDEGTDRSEADMSGTLMIEGRYVIETAERTADLAGCAAYPARDTLSSHHNIIALGPETVLAARSNAQKLARLRSPHLLAVRTLDDSSGSIWIICDAPPGPPLSRQGAGWTELAVLERLIEPMASILHAYKEAGLTHRAIRPDNVFDPGGRLPVRLGPGLAAPPAYFQPDRFEPLSSIICMPAARGEGTIADDIFALGALAAWLLGGAVPYEGEQPGARTEERMERGSFAVLAGHLSLSPDIASLLAAMLSDDPRARPTPRDLLNVSARKGFVPRRSTVAATPIQLGPTRIRTARALAWQATRYEAEFTSLLRRGIVERWLVHELGLTQAAARLGAIVKEMGASEDAAVGPARLMEILVVLDSTLPMYWQNLWLWPDALGTLAAASVSGTASGPFPVADLAAAIVEVIQSGLLPRFGQMSSVEGQVASCQQVQVAARQAMVDDPLAVVRLAYVLNPFQACLSARCASQRFSASWALLRWLNSARDIGQSGNGGLLDSYMTTFLLASAHRSGLIEYFDDIAVTGASRWQADLRLLAKLQGLYMTGPLSGVAQRLLPHLGAALKLWRSRSTRIKRTEQLVAAAGSGDLVRMMDVLGDQRALNRDRDEWHRAQHEIVLFKDELGRLEREPLNIPPRTRVEMIRLTTAIGTVAAIASLCMEAVL